MSNFNLLAQQTLDSINIPILLVDSRLRMVFWNLALRDLMIQLDWPLNDPIGKPVQEIFSFLPRRATQEIRTVFATGEPIFTESTNTFKGLTSTMEVSIHPIRGAAKVTEVVIMLREVSRERETQRALVESQERFRLQFESIPVPTFTWEARGDDFILVGFNQAAEQFTKGQIGKIVGRSAFELYGKDSDIVRDLRECLTSRTLQKREMRYSFKSIQGSLYVSAYYVFIPPNQVQAHAVDLTEYKLAEERHRVAHEQLEVRIQSRTRELAEANELLKLERETLERKTQVLQELIKQVAESRHQAALQIQSNIDRVVVPLVEHLEKKIDQRYRENLALIKQNLQEITSPLVSTLEQKFRHLTPQEIQICSLIRRGYSSKEIAELRSSSVQTVLTQRKTIRKKLGLAHQDTNLATYLTSLPLDVGDNSTSFP
ncbi:MAG: PAS domain-containing protein [candidate division Zixibacteria bacterium]|nr:PAS domain-containing protein [candidate division Zixibacteria bacterium]